MNRNLNLNLSEIKKDIPSSDDDDKEEDEEDVELINVDLIFNTKSNWYQKSEVYWNGQDATEDAMTGGFPQYNEFDIAQSEKFISKYQKSFGMGRERVADCGCGVGRVSRMLLQRYFDNIDLIEPIPKFLSIACSSLQKSNVKFTAFNTGLQNFEPNALYDAFWIQWPIMYMTDKDAVAFLKRASQHLAPNGKIFVKDNLGTQDLSAPKEYGSFDADDHSLCRTYLHYKSIFEEAGLKILESERLEEWGKDLLPLYLFVLSL